MASDATARGPGKRGPGRPRNHPVEEQRRLILLAARDVFASYDFHGTTIERVARTAGVTRPTVYELFGNKEDLFVAVVDDVTTRLSNGIHRALRRDEGLAPRDVIRADVASLFEFIDRSPEDAAIIRIVEHGASGPAKEQVLAGRRRIEEEVAATFRTLWSGASGLSAEGARLLALMSLSLTEVVGFRQPDEKAWASDDTIDYLTDFIVGGLDRLAMTGQAESFGRGGGR